MRNIFSALLIAILIHCSLHPANAVVLRGRFQVEGSEFVLFLDDGRVLRRQELVDLTLSLSLDGTDTAFRIAGIDEDAATNGPVILYRITSVGTHDRPAVNLCDPDIHGRQAGFPLPNAAGGFNFVCTSGAAGKCVLMGYRPWETSAGTPLAALHRACVHMLRADYGGDDRPTTRNGTAVDIYDRFDIQRPAMRTDMRFEAAWGENGAICVAHPRIPQNITLTQIAERYPRLADRLGMRICTEEAMRAAPEALLFNRSVVGD